MIRFPILFLALACCATSKPHDDLDTYHASVGSYAYNNTIDIGDVMPEPLAEAYMRFRQMAAAGVKNVTLRIDSPGGSIFAGNRFIKAMEDVKKTNGITVMCVVDGMAYSMGAVILESPLCDRRLATVRSTILFHNGSTGASGTAEDLKQATEFLEALNQSLALQISARLGMTLEAYRARIAHTNWVMACPEALLSNVIDATVSSTDIAPPSES